MESLFFGTAEGRFRIRDLLVNGADRIRRIDLSDGAVSIHLRLGTGQPWRKRVESFDRMAVFVDVLGGELGIEGEGKAWSFGAGEALLLAAGAGRYTLALMRDEPVEVYALFLSDFFLKAYRTGEASDPVDRLANLLEATPKGLFPVRRCALGTGMARRTRRLLEPESFSGIGPLRYEWEVLGWLVHRLEFCFSGEDSRYGAIVEKAVGRLFAALPSVPGVEELADFCGVGTTTLKKAFVHVTGQPPGRHLRRLRLEYARGLIVREGFGVAAAARASGFRHVGHFCRLFQEAFGYLPGALR